MNNAECCDTPQVRQHGVAARTNVCDEKGKGCSYEIGHDTLILIRDEKQLDRTESILEVETVIGGSAFTQQFNRLEDLSLGHGF